jgi:NAD(P)-dependent dehydrogenase (short-subunit alcohol dehydrogenase family)
MVTSARAVRRSMRQASMPSRGSRNPRRSRLRHRAVRVNAVTPGPIETEMLNRFTGSAERKAGLVAGVPLQRVGKPDEIANAIVFLASDRSSFTTGQALFVDGGKSAI